MLRTPRLARTLLAAVPAALAASGAAPAAAAVRVSAKPSLYPHFRRDVTDYVSRCVPGRALRLSVRATGGEKVTVGSHRARSGHFTRRVRRRTGAAVTLRVSSSRRRGTYHVRCLARRFPRWVARRAGTPQAQWYVLTPNGKRKTGYIAIFDAHGVPVWWRHASSYSPWDAQPMPGGTIAWTHYVGGPFGQAKAYGYEEHRFDGRRVRRVRAVGTPTDTHDMRQLPNRHLLVIAYRPRTGVDLRAFGGPARAKVFDGEIQELTRDGRLVWAWNSRNHIGLAETGYWWPRLNRDQRRKRFASHRFWDLVHLNSVEPDGDGVIVSARHLDAVFRIDRRTKRITWKLGGTQRPESLDVIGDPWGDHPFRGQHDARLYADGTLTVYDNATRLERRPRAVRYLIDATARTAELREDVEAHDVTDSPFGGSARKLPGGNWVVYWGGSTLVTEQTPAGRRVFSLRFRHRRTGYRAAPLLPGQVSATTLRRGMDRIAKRRGGRASR